MSKVKGRTEKYTRPLGEEFMSGNRKLKVVASHNCVGCFYSGANCLKFLSERGYCDMTRPDKTNVQFKDITKDSCVQKIRKFLGI